MNLDTFAIILANRYVIDLPPSVRGPFALVTLAVLVMAAIALIINQKKVGEKPGGSKDKTAKYEGPRCVSCQSPISKDTKLCPKCGYTQPI